MITSALIIIGAIAFAVVYVALEWMSVQKCKKIQAYKYGNESDNDS